VLEFDQPVKWNNALAGQFYLDGVKGKVASGSAAGNTLTLKLAARESFRPRAGVKVRVGWRCWL
jgi:hypothetical protein